MSYSLASVALFVFAGFTVAGTVGGQVPQAGPADSVTLSRNAARLRAQADSLGRGSGADRRVAVALLRQASALYAKAGAPRQRAGIHSAIGRLFADANEPDSALMQFHEALVLASAAGDRSEQAEILNTIGVFFISAGQPDSALTYFRRELPIERTVGDRNTEARTLHRIGVALAAIGPPDSALEYYRRALSMRHDVGDRAGEAGTTNNIGALLLGLGQPDSAVAYYRRALAIRVELGNVGEQAQTMTNIGGIFSSIGQPDSAMVYHRRALAIFHNAGDARAEAAALSNISTAFRHLHQLDSALYYARQALPILHAGSDRAKEALVLSNIAAYLSDLAFPDSALAYLRLALPMTREGNDRTGEAYALNAIGALLFDYSRDRQSLRYSQPDSALGCYRQALRILNTLDDRAGEAQVLSNIGGLFRRTGSLDSALVYLDRATAMYGGISTRAGSEVNEVSYNQTTSGTYRNLTLAWLDFARGADGFPSTQAGNAALAATERGRAQALQELMGKARTIAPGADLAAEGAAIAARALRSAGAGLIYSATDDTLIIWLVLPNGKIVTSEQAVASARVDTLVAGMLYGIAGSNAQTLRGPGAARGVAPWLDPLDSMLLTEGVTRRASVDRGLALRREMAEMLLPQAIRAQLPAGGELIVVPYGGLGLIPFGLLPVGPDSVLLGDRFALRYGPSLVAIAEAEDRALQSPPGTDRAGQLVPALIVGDPTMPPLFRVEGQRPLALGDLPAARAEGEAVADSLGVTQWLTGDRATETAVREQLPKARLVHLATHGVVYGSDAHAALSFIALAPDPRRGYDGHLSVRKIVDSLSLRAELVVLSACQTGAGNVKTAEGTLGLQRAMLAKGARSVLVSLWNVNDESTLFLIQRFYHHWLHDVPSVTKSEALRMAQTDVRAEARNSQRPDRQLWSDPFYWAAFQVVGAP